MDPSEKKSLDYRAIDPEEIEASEVVEGPEDLEESEIPEEVESEDIEAGEEEIFPWRAYGEETPAKETPTFEPAEEESQAPEKAWTLSDVTAFLKANKGWILAGLAALLVCLIIIYFYQTNRVLTQPVQVQENWQSVMLKGPTLYYREGENLVARQGARENFRIPLGDQVRDVAYGSMIYVLADDKLRVLDMDSGDSVREKEAKDALWVQPLADQGAALGMKDRVLLLDANLEVKSVREARSTPYAFYQTAMGTAHLDAGPLQKSLTVQGTVRWDPGIAPYPSEDRTLSFLAIQEENRDEVFLPFRRPLLDIMEGPDKTWLVLADRRLLVIREGALLKSIPLAGARDWALGEKLAVVDGVKVRLFDPKSWEEESLAIDFLPDRVLAYQGSLYIIGEGKLARLNGEIREGNLALKPGIAQPIIDNLDGPPAAVTDRGLVYLDQVELKSKPQTPEK